MSFFDRCFQKTLNGNLKKGLMKKNRVECQHYRFESNHTQSTTTEKEERERDHSCILKLDRNEKQLQSIIFFFLKIA